MWARGRISTSTSRFYLKRGRPPAAEDCLFLYSIHPSSNCLTEQSNSLFFFFFFFFGRFHFPIRYRHKRWSPFNRSTTLLLLCIQCSRVNRARAQSELFYIINVFAGYDFFSCSRLILGWYPFCSVAEASLFSLIVFVRTKPAAAPYLRPT